MTVITVTENELMYGPSVDKSHDLEPVESEQVENLDDLSYAIQHPLGIKPSGNALTDAEKPHISLGSLSSLPDTILLMILEFLDEQDLSTLTTTCRGLYGFGTHDQLWRDLAVDDIDPQFTWRGSWRSSIRKLKTESLAKVDCRGLYSDALYRPYLCSQTPPSEFAASIPKTNEITRFTNLTRKHFMDHWTSTPFILTDPVKQWRVYNDWNQDYLLQRYGDTVFRAEAVDWSLKTYTKYMNQNQDESPLYLFDCQFVEKMKLKIGYQDSYQAPECFDEDMLNVLGSQRPDHRWLIIGPERSGSTFHKDPNATSAWNAVIRGSKYWIMFPSSITPPGVFVSDDLSEVTSPLSIAEWLLTFHRYARDQAGCVEGVCKEGEMLYVPSGWWHLVVNLEPSIAITQNFVPRSHLQLAVNFLQKKASQVSGFKSDIQDPYKLFMERLQQLYPDLAATVQSVSSKKRKWEELVGSNSEENDKRNGFGFGFDNADISDED